MSPADLTLIIQKLNRNEKFDLLSLAKDTFEGAVMSYLGNKIVPRGPGRPAKNLKALISGKIAQRSYKRELVEVGIKTISATAGKTITNNKKTVVRRRRYR